MEVIDIETELREKAMRRPAQAVNVGDVERAVSVLAGATLLTMGVIRSRLSGLTLGAVGAAILHRGMTGHCHAYEMMGTNRAIASGGAGNAGVLHKGIRVEETMVVHRPAAELYRLWRDFSRLPEFMKHVHTVEMVGPNRSHWTVEGPYDQPVEWDAEVYNERENELIAWRSLEDSEVATAGSVHFRDCPEGTEIDVQVSYDPPGGKLGAIAATFLKQAPATMIAEDLRRFKSFAERQHSR